MNILITRPLIDAEDLMGKFFSLGHKIIHIPTLKIYSVKVDPVDESKYNAFIFTSANAIRNLKVIKQDKSKLCFCVGAITEKIARMSGYNNTISAGGTVNALKNLIINEINDFNVYISYTLRMNEFDYECDPSIIYEVDITRVNCLGKFDQGSIPELDAIFINN